MGIADFVKGKKAEKAKVECKECEECGEMVPKDEVNSEGLCEDCATE